MVRVNERIKTTINKLFTRYGTCNPFTLADYLGIEIQYVPFGSNPQGQYIKILDEHCILINSRLKGTEESYFVLAHEIFHFLEHEELIGYYVMTEFTRGKLEQEANAFATILLLNYYVEEYGGYPSTFKEVAFRFGIPNEVTENYI